MEKNVGPIDAVIRVTIGVVAAYLGAVWNQWWYVLTVLMILTAVTRWCLLYTIFGWNTNKHNPLK